jgi:nucleotide-binding universal stress UspA family protein
VFRHVLVPTDGSSLSDMAVKRAVSFVKEAKAQLTFFFAEPDETASLLDGDAALLRTIDPEKFASTVARHIQAVLGKAQEVAAAEGVSSAALSVVSDEPYLAIITAAEERGCDLIMMASHGRRGVKGMLLGSQTQKVLLHSKIPVLIYR